MPARSNRNGRNKDTHLNAPSNSASSPATQRTQPNALSPPTQLPTPLPEENLASTQPGSSATLAPALHQDDVLSHLIDFEPPTEDFGAAHADFYATHNAGHDAYMDRFYDYESGEGGEEERGGGEAATYRSPPFREAQLPDSVMNLPILHRVEETPLPIPPPRTTTAMPAPLRPVHFQPGSPSQASSAASSPPARTRVLSPRGAQEYMPSSPPRFPPSSISPHSTFPPRLAGEDIPPALSWRPGPVSDIPGHVTAPILQRPSSTLDRVTRTLREYVPSVGPISIPTVSPSKPLLSTPLSFGTFTGRGGESEPVSRGRGEQYRGYGAREDGYGHYQGQRWEDGDAYGGYAEEGERLMEAQESLRERAKDASVSSSAFEVPLWSRFQRVSDRLLLVLGYQSGLGIWDCTNLKQVTEILNINSFDGILSAPARQPRLRAVHAAVVPPPDARSLRAAGLKEDSLSGDRPLIGILLDSGASDGSTFLLYSLRRNVPLKRITLPGYADTFIADTTCIVISTTRPPTLHILSSTTFDIVHSIASSSLVPFTHSTSSNKPSNELSISTPITHTHRKSVSLVSGPFLDSYSSSTSTEGPAPVFALKGRLLAYASAAVPAPASSSSTPRPANASPTFTLPLGQGITQSDIGTAAWKVGGSMLSGMKTLGGMAFDAAKNKLGGEIPPVSGGSGDPGGFVSLTGRIFSRSAPAAAGYTPGNKERRYSTASSSAPRDAKEQDSDHPKTLAPHAMTKPENGYHVTVLDLATLLSGGAAPSPRKVATFKAAQKNRISYLNFSNDGTQIVVVPEHGHDCRVYALRPTPSVNIKRADGDGMDKSALSAARQHETAWRLYTLRRGVSPAAVEAIDWTDDGRWVAIGSNHRTVHVFAVNPYGGPPDIRSHIEGRVKNTDVLQPFGVDISRAVKIHLKSLPAETGQSRVPLAFTFIHPSDATYPSHVTSQSLDVMTSSPPLSRRSGCQDLLVFDPVPGKLSLYRVTATERLKDQQFLSGSLSGIGRPSISLPGIGGAGVLSISPSTSVSNRASAQRGSGPVSPTAAAPTEMACEAHIAAFWHVRRQKNWTEVAYPWSVVAQGLGPSPPAGNLSDVNWLAEAELWTHSRSDKILPRSLYASHQFMFYTLGEDYHALMRRWHFNITGQRIEVRKEVEVSAHGIGVGENFVSSSFSPMHTATSIENPLASALEAELQYTNPHAVLPMYPNGTPGSKPRSFTNSIPIRAAVAGIGDGVTEGLGRFRRKVNSPPFRAHSDDSSPSVPLEFEEDDAHFPYPDALYVPSSRGEDTSTSRGGGSADSAPSISISTPLTAPREEGLVEMAEDDLYYGWEMQDQQAIEDAERFDDISVVGFLDEEQASMRQVMQNKEKRRRKK